MLGELFQTCGVSNALRSGKPGGASDVKRKSQEETPSGEVEKNSPREKTFLGSGAAAQAF